MTAARFAEIRALVCAAQRTIARNEPLSAHDFKAVSDALFEMVEELDFRILDNLLSPKQ